jgi:hypothetical protein
VKWKAMLERTTVYSNMEKMEYMPGSQYVLCRQ